MSDDKANTASPDGVLSHFERGFETAHARNKDLGRRIGAELKFPIVADDGQAVPRETVDALWHYLIEQGWEATVDTPTGRTVGARIMGEYNHTLASCETGYCKAEFSLAHVANLFELREAIERLRKLLHPFLEKHNAHMLCYGIQPITPPSSRLLMKKARSGFWDKVFPSNRVIPPEDGDDVHMFTVNATSHVHISVSREEAVTAVNVLNGFAGAQIALTANSSVWRGAVDSELCCVNEELWDRWRPAAGRVGVPEHAYTDLNDYVDSIAALRPVFVKRDGIPHLLGDRYGSFAEYYGTDEVLAETVEGEQRRIRPEPADIDVHNSCYWYSARISRYYTVENRLCDQQPPEALTVPAAITLGLVAASDRAWEELSKIDWQTLRALRSAACRDGMRAEVNGFKVTKLCETMIAVADEGLRRRGLGEEAFLQPLRERLSHGSNPADKAADLVNKQGIGSIVESYSF